MRLIKDLILALNFVSMLVGAGLATGKEVVVFLGSANYLSIILCATLIGCFAYPFFYLGIDNEGSTLSALFPKNEWLGFVVIKTINFIFLATLFGAADELLKEICGLNYGGFIMAILTLLIFEIGEKYIKALNSISVPLILIILLILFYHKHSKITGSLSIIMPLLYAGMNTACAGIFASKYCKGLNKKDAYIICLMIASFLSLLFIVVKSLVLDAEFDTIPLYSVSVATNLPVFGGIVIFISIFTSCLSSLKLTTSKKPMNPYLICSLALVFSFLGFNNMVFYLYPAIGILGIFLLVVASYRMLHTKLKNCKKYNLDL